MIPKHALPPLGHRIIKTAVAVFICLLIHLIRNFQGAVIQSAIAAVICIQPYVSDSKAFAIERVTGTVIGSLWGFLYLGLMYAFPILGQNIIVAYIIMSLFVVIALYSTVVIKLSNTACQVGIVLLSTVIAFPNLQSPISDAFNTMLDTTIGTIVAIGVNVFHLPRKKHPNYLFFVRTQDLVPDRYRHIPSAVHIMLDHLYNDGARICLVSRWVPAFIISQMGLLNVNAPIIIMNGAGLYDIRDNRYLEVVEIPHKNAEYLKGVLGGLGAACNIYTVHNNTMCIYHSGEVTEAEEQEYALMRRSPYRNYLEGPYHDEDRIAIIRVMDKTEHIKLLAKKVAKIVPTGMFRMEVLKESHFPGYSGLYFYDSKATVDAMKHRILDFMENECATRLEPVNVLPPSSRYQPEHDALSLLSRLKNTYEPISFFPNFSAKKQK